MEKEQTNEEILPADAAGSGRYPDLPRVAVGAVVFKEEAVLLVRRANPPGQGSWAIPGGRVRLGETLQAAAEREIREETGVIIQARQPVFVFDSLCRDEGGRMEYHYVIVDLAADYLSGTPRPADDAADARWVTASDLSRLAVQPITRRLLAEVFQFGKEAADDDPVG